MKGLARSYLWWPGLDQDIQNLVNQCETCLSVRNKPPLAPLQTWGWPSRVWQRLHVDYAELKGQHLFIVIDSHSKWVEVYPMKITTTNKTLDILRRLFSSYGLPEEIVSDNGPQFISSDFAEFMNRNGIIHKRVAPYHPASNGAAERTVQIVKKALIKQLLYPNPRKRNLSLHHKLANFLITYRNSPHTTTGRTPAELFLKRQPRTRFSLLKPNLAQEIDRKQAKQTEYHDKGRVQERILHVDDRVRVKSNVGGLVKSLPGKVTKVCGSRTYLIYMYNNCKIRFVHIDHILSSKEKGVPCRSADNPSVDVQVPLISPEGLPIEVLDGPEKSENGKGTPGQKDQVPLSVDPQIADIHPSPLVPSAGIAQERRYPVRV
ncbi:uncharacterized protein K02A2.6-like, partial [Anneissia japonica]|uniref:uncharacterized protein K02A2.6-like n=1 Tax=Anneissia japonica TaxID=1529436 RepID=UPI0014254DEF